MTQHASGADTSRDRYVAVVGVGAVTGYGWGRKHLRQGLLSGQSAARPVPGYSSHFPADRLWVARVPDDGPPPDEGEDSAAPALRWAVREALEDAHDRGWRPGPTVGVVHCLVPDELGEGAGAVLGGGVGDFDFHGPVVGVSANSASTIAGLLTAKSWIESGVADDVLVLNSDLDTSPERCDLLWKAGVLAADGPTLERCRPFQYATVGFAPGEAVVALVVSSLPEGAYTRVLGGAMAFDELHSSPSALRATPVERAFRAALDNAGVAAGEVAYLNAHAAGVPESDAVEAAAFDDVFPGAAGIFSLKPLVGHCQAAAGAVELYASLHGFETGVIPAPHRVGRGHPRLLDGPTAAAEGLMAKASLGMSGHHAVLVLGPPAA
jgi:3-oxoacyl-[acyl-carrier-protein] synthase II